MFSGILEGMETFRFPNPTPNAVPSRAQGLVDRIATAFRALPDGRKRGNNTKYSLFDAACSAFTVFFTQCGSFLGFQCRRKPRSAISSMRFLPRRSPL